MGDCFMLKTAFKKQVKSPRNIIFYATVMILTYALIWVYIYPAFIHSDEWIVYLTSSFFTMSMILWVAAWLKDPGMIK